MQENELDPPNPTPDTELSNQTIKLECDNCSEGSAGSADEYEPLFNYTRVKGDLDTIFQKDSASIVTVSDKFLVLGTHWGHIYVLDLLGNISKDWASHNAAVTSLSLNECNEYLVSGGDDGYVILHELFTGERRVVANHLRPVKAVAIEPSYTPAEGKIASGGLLAQLIVHEERKWPLNKRDILVDENKGAIRSILWKGSFLASANEQGVIIYDAKSFTPLTIIEHLNPSLNPEIYPVRLFWESNKTLAVLWGNHVQLVDLEYSTHHQTPTEKTINISASISSILENDEAIVGISSLNSNYIFLSYPGEIEGTDGSSAYSQSETNGSAKSKKVDGKKLSPGDNASIASTSELSLELRVINEEHEEILNDLLKLPSMGKYKASDYNLITLNVGANNQDSIWYIVSPKQILEMRLRTFGQHISWLVESKQIELAFINVSNALETGAYKFGALEKDVDAKLLLQVAQLYAQELMLNVDYEKAIDVISLSLGYGRSRKQDIPESEIANLWETWAFEFAPLGQLPLVAKYIPTDLPGISQTVYEMILAELLELDLKYFCAVAKRWPVGIYSVNSIEIAVVDKIKRLNGENNIKDATDIELLHLMLADVLNRSGQIDKAIIHYLILHYPDIIQRVEKENLGPSIRKEAMLIMEYDEFYISERGRLNNAGTTANANENESQPSDNTSDLERAIAGEGVSLLVRNVLVIPPATVVPQLLDKPWFIHVYLHALYQIDRDVGSQFADMQVELYAEYNPELLIGFLRNNHHYDLGKAFQICEARSLVAEMVYLLGRMGDFRKALLVILYDLQDVRQAIEFAREQHDEELWGDLVRISGLDGAIDNTALGTPGSKKRALGAQAEGFSSELIEELRLALISDADGKFVSSTALLRSIPPKTKIRGLDQAVMAKLRNFRLRVDLMSSCQLVLNSYNHSLSMQWRGVLSKGVNVDTTENCRVCNQPLFSAEKGGCDLLGSAPSPEAGISFWCGHSFHNRCLLLPQVMEKVVESTTGGRKSEFVENGSRRNYAAKGVNRYSYFDSLSYRNYFVQAKLDRTRLIKQYAKLKCPVCKFKNSVGGSKLGQKATRNQDKSGNQEDVENESKNQRGDSETGFARAMSSDETRWSVPVEFTLNGGSKPTELNSDLDTEQSDYEELPNIEQLKLTG